MAKPGKGSGQQPLSAVMRSSTGRSSHTSTMSLVGCSSFPLAHGFVQGGSDLPRLGLAAWGFAGGDGALDFFPVAIGSRLHSHCAPLDRTSNSPQRKHGRKASKARHLREQRGGTQFITKSTARGSTPCSGPGKVSDAPWVCAMGGRASQRRGEPSVSLLPSIPQSFSQALALSLIPTVLETHA